MRLTPSYDNRLAVQSAENDYYVANKHRMYPMQFESLYTSLVELAGNKTKFVASDRYDAAALERWLDVNVKSDDTIWYGVKVIKLNMFGTGITNGGLATYLFIDEGYIASLGKGWIGTVTSSYMALKLYPKTAGVAAPQHSEFTASIKKSLLPITNVLLLKLASMSIYFVIDDNLTYRFIESLVRYSNYLSEDQYSAVCNEAIKKMGTFKGNRTYCGSKNKLVPYDIPERYRIELVSEYKLPDISVEKCKDLLYQHIVYAIRSIPEEAHTGFWFRDRQLSLLYLQASQGYNTRKGAVPRDSGTK